MPAHRKVPPEILELRSVYQNAQINLINTIARKKARGNVTAFSESLLRQVNKELAALDQFAISWTAEQIGGRYMVSAERTYSQLRQANLTIADYAVDPRRIRILAANAAGQLIDAHQFVGRTINDYIRQAGIEAAAQKFATGATVKETKRILIDKLTSHGITGIRDKRGRLIRLDAYAETVARSTTREASNLATVEQLQAHDHDLVEMSSHASACRICAPLEGRVYSISGTDGRYPRLDFAYGEGYANIHPNCQHVLTPYIEKFDSNAERKRQESNRSFDTDPRSKAQQDAYNAAQRKNTVLRNDRNQWERYRLAMPADTPATFSAFRRSKTAGGPLYNELESKYRSLAMRN